MFGFRKTHTRFQITGQAPNPTISLQLKKGKNELKRKNRGYTKRNHD